MAAGYPIPAAEAQVELRFKNSRFIGTAGPAPTVEEARAFIARLREQFPDASHHAYAFAAGFGSSVIHGMSDDGEPAGTAGRPMLAVVQGAGLGDVGAPAHPAGPPGGIAPRHPGNHCRTGGARTARLVADLF